MSAMLELSGVTKRYKLFSFGPVDFQLDEGVITGIIGPNGSGKSTFFRIMMNLIRPDEGAVKWFGLSDAENEDVIKQKIGYAASGLYDIFGHLSVKELASLVSYWYENWDQTRFYEMIDRYEVNLKQKYQNCSTGTKKKVDFILAMVHQPRLLLLDEHSAGVDMMSQRKMKEDLLRHMESGENSIILATHQQEEVQQMCDRLCIMKRGQLIHTMDKDEAQHEWARVWISELPEKVRHHPFVKDASEQPPQIVTDRLPEIEKLLQQEGITIHHVQRLEIGEVIEYIING